MKVEQFFYLSVCRRRKSVCCRPQVMVIQTETSASVWMWKRQKLQKWNIVQRRLWEEVTDTQGSVSLSNFCITMIIIKPIKPSEVWVLASHHQRLITSLLTHSYVTLYDQHTAVINQFILQLLDLSNQTLYPRRGGGIRKQCIVGKRDFCTKVKELCFDLWLRWFMQQNKQKQLEINEVFITDQILCSLLILMKQE